MSTSSSILIVLDFEATCWSQKTNCPPNEIIEFPAVLLDTESGRILEEFHSYVLPTEQPRLSAFCQELTGISQDTVDGSGVPLGTCLMLFNRWMATITEKYKLALNDVRQGSKTTTFVTWYGLY